MRATSITGHYTLRQVLVLNGSALKIFDDSAQRSRVGDRAQAQPPVIFTDLDGTLLRTDGTVSRVTREMVHLCLSIGVPVIPVTARSSASAATALSWLDVPVPMICQSGSIQFDPKGRGATRSTPIPQSTLNRLLTALRAKAIPFAVDTDTVKLLEPQSEHLLEYLPPCPHYVVSTLDINAPVFTVVIERTREAEALLPHLQADHPRLAFFPTSLHTIDVAAAGVNKLTAIQDLCTSYGITPSAAIAVGDGDNDADMLSFVGFGVAVANASARLRAVADCVLTLTNDQDAVAELLRETLEHRLRVQVASLVSTPPRRRRANPH